METSSSLFIFIPFFFFLGVISASAQHCAPVAFGQFNLFILIFPTVVLLIQPLWMQIQIDFQMKAIINHSTCYSCYISSIMNARMWSSFERIIKVIQHIRQRYGIFSF